MKEIISNLSQYKAFPYLFLVVGICLILLSMRLKKKSENGSIFAIVLQLLSAICILFTLEFYDPKQFLTLSISVSVSGSIMFALLIFSGISFGINEESTMKANKIFSWIAIILDLVAILLYTLFVK